MILIYRRDPRYLTFFYLNVNLAGLKDAALQHSEPFYYYLKTVPEGLLPWTIPAVAAVVFAMREAIRQGLRTAPVSLIWLVSLFVGGFVLLSIPAAKLATYSLPLFSSGALITADYLVKTDGRSWVLRGLVPLQSAVAVVAFLVLVFLWETGHAAQSWQNLNLWMAGLVCVVSVCGLIITAVSALRGRIGTSMMALGITVGIAFPLVVMQAPRVATWRSSQGLCEQYKEQLAAADLVIISDSKDFSVPLTLRRRVAVLGRARELGMGLFVKSQPADKPIPSDPFRLESEAVGSFYLLSSDDLAKVWASERVVYIFVSENDMDKVQSHCPNMFIVATNGETVLLTNRDPAELSQPPVGSGSPG
jgi:energy-converting hydrogenase Eha subunit C